MTCACTPMSTCAECAEKMMSELPTKGLLAQIEVCRREVAQWPQWMKQTTTAPKWMEGWDD